MFFLFIALLLAAFPVRAQVAAIQPWTLRDAFQVKVVGGVTVSPDGSMVAFVVSDNTPGSSPHIHVTRSGEHVSRQLETNGPALAPEWCPDAERMYICFLKIGPKATQNVWRMPLDGGTAEAVTDLDRDVLAYRWAPTRDRIAFLMRDAPVAHNGVSTVVGENPRKVSLYVMSPGANSTLRHLGAPNGYDNFGRMNLGMHFDWSNDGQQIAFVAQDSPGSDQWTTQRVKVVNVSVVGEAQPLTTMTNRAEAQPKFSPDCKKIALVMSDRPPTWSYTRRAYIVADGGGKPQPLAHTPDRQPSLLGWSADCKQVYVTETLGVMPRLYALSTDGRKAVAVGQPDIMVDSARTNATGTHVGFISETSDRPAEVYTADLRAAILNPLKRSAVQSPVPEKTIGKTKVLQWKSSDGRQIEGLVTYPPSYNEGDGPIPLVVLLHGGPTLVFTDSFTGKPHVPEFPAIFASRGYAVLRPNVRGSSGYGKHFRYANVGDWGGGDYRDVLGGVDRLVRDKVADPQKMAIAGVSYGGYLTAWTVTQTHRFKAATVIAGMTDLISYTGTADVPSYTPGNLNSEFWDKPRLWWKRSPLAHVKQLQTPTLILHTQNDTRVPVSQSHEFYTALVRRGLNVKDKKVELVLYPGSLHGIWGPAPMCDALNRVLLWFDSHVKGVQPAEEKCFD